jgi:hypothetical protein
MTRYQQQHPTQQADQLPVAAAAGRARLLALSLTFALASCGGGGGDTQVLPPAPPPIDVTGAVERNVKPRDVDAAVTTALEDHVAITPATIVPAANKLIVFLPGTLGVPDLYRLILRSGASRGFHGIGLNYPNDTAVGTLCLGALDANCFWDVRREVITGQDLSAKVNVGVADAIVTRLTKLVTRLRTNFPAEGWGQYLKADGTLEWSKITVGGHSQGGGHAGVLTKLFAMNRACYFGSPPDWETGRGPADWLAFTNVTPASKQFGFASTTDSAVPYSELGAIWQAIGLNAFGSVLAVDANTVSFGSTHLVSTNAAADPAAGNDPGNPSHGLTVRDAFTPKYSNGRPVFDPVWDYLCFE